MSSRKLLQVVFGLTLIVVLLLGCSDAKTEPTAIPTSVPSTATPTVAPPTATLRPAPSTATPTPVPPATQPSEATEAPTATAIPTATLESLTVASVCDQHPYNWQPEDVKGLDMWGDSVSDATDIVAIYEREVDSNLEFRLDIMNFEDDDELAPIYFAIDLLEGGSNQVDPGNSLSFEIEWDLLVSVVNGEFKLYDPTFTEITDLFTTTEINRQLDFVFFAIEEGAFSEWDGEPFQIQALLLDSTNSAVLDSIAPVASDNITGRAKLVLPFEAVFVAPSPSSAVNHYDGFVTEPIGGGENTDERLGTRRGYRYLLDAVEKYEIPLTQTTLQINELPGGEYLRIHERYRHLASMGLFDPLTTLGYGHFMPLQPDDVDARAIEIAIELRDGLDLLVSDVFYPYEGMLTPGDIQVIKEAGFEVIYAPAQGRYSFFGFIDDPNWNQEIYKDEIEILRKIHQFNGMKFLFYPMSEYTGVFMDSRWEPIDWENYPDEFGLYTGTDQGLHLFWRRALHDMALDPDQEQFFAIGTDLNFTSWGFQDVVGWNFQWLASHPWTEVTTFSSIVNRGWEVVDHGELEAATDELLMRYKYPGDWYYNAYFPYHYYGGISDGHSPLIPAGAEIESYYDYIPYLRAGELIPTERIMGDDKTPGSMVYETLANLRNAPDNPITTIAWLSYFNHIGEQAFHEGGTLIELAKNQANLLGQVNKIVAAANWAAEAAQGVLGNDTQIYEKDLDLDGELEYVMHNDQVFALFENDGGRLEFAFAYDPEYGPIQLIAPASQYFFRPDPNMGFDIQNGEVTIPLGWPDVPDGAFVEDIDLDGNFEYEPLTATVEEQSLTFSYENHPVTKTFTLEGDTIRIHYERGSSETLNLGLANAVNQLGVFGKDWIWNFEPIEMQEVVGWQMTSGGAVLLNMEGDYNLETASFYDSLAREEMSQAEDDSGYPPGHWMCFPCSWIKIWDTQEVDFSLILSVAPIDKSTYTPLPTSTPTPTAAPPTPTLSPEQEVSLFIYDDAARAGWTFNAWDGEIDLSSESVVYNGQKAIEANMDPWGAFGMWPRSLDISQYLYLELLINGGSQGGQLVHVLSFNGEEVLANLPISEYTQAVTLPPGEWLTVRIPVEDLNPEGSPVTGIVIENHSDNAAATFNVDEIRFVSSGR